MKTINVVKACLVSGFIVGLIVGFVFRGFITNDDPVWFDSHQWKEMANNRRNERASMVADLHAKYLRYGADESEIRELLGEPNSGDEIGTAGRSEAWYYLGNSNRGLFGSIGDQLVVVFKDGKLVDYGIVSD